MGTKRRDVEDAEEHSAAKAATKMSVMKMALFMGYDKVAYWALV